MQPTQNEIHATGLLLIDTVNDFLTEGGKAHPLVKDLLRELGTVQNLERLLRAARDHKLPVFHAPMAYTDEDYTTWKHLTGIHKAMYDQRMFERGSWGADFVESLRPRPGETVILPHKNLDVTATTDLDTQLRQRGVEFVLVGGMSATLCVESTVRSLMERGYHVTLVEDATAAIGGREAYDQALRGDYPMFAHGVAKVEEILRRLEEGAAARAA